jgi:hypothetical protein
MSSLLLLNLIPIFHSLFFFEAAESRDIKLSGVSN